MWVVHQKSLAVNMHPFLHDKWQKCAMDFFMFVLDHVWAEVPEFCANMSEHFQVVKNTAHQRQEDIVWFFKCWIRVGVCSSSVPMTTMLFADPLQPAVMEGIRAAFVRLREIVLLFVDKEISLDYFMYPLCGAVTFSCLLYLLWLVARMTCFPPHAFCLPLFGDTM